NASAVADTNRRKPRRFRAKHDPEKWVPVFGKDHASLTTSPPPCLAGAQMREGEFHLSQPKPRAMSKLKITAGPFTFDARLETEAAPKTCAAFLKHMPFKSQVVHVRWSGEGVWIPLGDLDFGVSYENHTSYPAPGQFLLYPGGISET